MGFLGLPATPILLSFNQFLIFLHISNQLLKGTKNMAEIMLSSLPHWFLALGLPSRFIGFLPEHEGPHLVPLTPKGFVRVEPDFWALNLFFFLLNIFITQVIEPRNIDIVSASDYVEVG